jgi:hypothetical protein
MTACNSRTTGTCQTRRAALKKPAPGAADIRGRRCLRQVFFLETKEKLNWETELSVTSRVCEHSGKEPVPDEWCLCVRRVGIGECLFCVAY